eukprot:3176789-Pyramimonas_sp.AAC.1
MPIDPHAGVPIYERGELRQNLKGWLGHVLASAVHGVIDGSSQRKMLGGSLRKKMFGLLTNTRSCNIHALFKFFKFGRGPSGTSTPAVICCRAAGYQRCLEIQEGTEGSEEGPESLRERNTRQ